MDRPRGDMIEARLGLWDAVSIIVGIIIGVGIFQNPSTIFEKVPGPWLGLGIWGLAGLLALLGALCFAELASTYPRSGGEYVYLTRAYGPLVGFLFGWAQLTVIRPGSIGALAYIVAERAAFLWRLNGMETFLLAVAAVLLLTLTNILGVTLGKNMQNFLTLAKVAGLMLLVVVGFGWGHGFTSGAAAAREARTSSFAGAMILALWTYSGWHEAAYIVSEIKDSRRNIPLALIMGAAAVTVIYLAVNAALLCGVGFEGARRADAPEQVLSLAWGSYGSRAISILIMISALGAINGMIFTTARIYAEFGHDHRLFQPLSKWSRRWGTPVPALVTEACLTLTLVVGITVWVSFDAVVNMSEGFNKMIGVTSAVFWLFFLLTGIALFLLRSKEPDTLRPFRVPAYPVVPVVFCLACAYMVYDAIEFGPWESLIGLGILLLGVLFYYMPKNIKRQPARKPEPPVPVGAV